MPGIPGERSLSVSRNTGRSSRTFDQATLGRLCKVCEKQNSSPCYVAPDLQPNYWRSGIQRPSFCKAAFSRRATEAIVRLRTSNSGTISSIISFVNLEEFIKAEPITPPSEQSRLHRLHGLLTLIKPLKSVYTKSEALQQPLFSSSHLQRHNICRKRYHRGLKERRIGTGLHSVRRRSAWTP